MESVLIYDFYIQYRSTKRNSCCRVAAESMNMHAQNRFPESRIKYYKTQSSGNLWNLYKCAKKDA